MTQKRKTLFVRFDRVGDLVLTLPVDLHPLFSDDDRTWLIAQGLEFVVQNAQPMRRFKTFAKDPLQKASLVQWLKEEKFDQAIVFYAPLWVVHALYQAGIRLRVGRRSQWWSYFLFNRGVRQKRSRAEHHERDYNYMLVEEALKFGKKAQWTSLKISFPRAPVSPPPLSYVVVHPGMGGSARNWPETHYRELIRQLLERGTMVVLTGTAIDRPYTEPLIESFKAHPNFKSLAEKLNGQELIQILQFALAIVAPSTGVLHLAASTGQPTLGIFSPVRVQRAERWGPLGTYATTLTPDVECPGKLQCLGEKCPFYDCMESVQPAEALTVIDRLQAAKKQQAIR